VGSAFSFQHFSFCHSVALAEREDSSFIIHHGSVVNISVPVPTMTTLTDAKQLTNDAFQFSFTNTVGALFGVLASTNPALPLSNWTALGGVTEVAPGEFQFADPQATNSACRFYRLRAP
jgi:hypothetical protein